MKKRMTAIILALVLVLAATGCSGGASEEPVKIATKPMTEQYILGEMLKILIEEKAGYEVELTKGIGGGTNNIHPAMEKGEFDLYPEYTSSGWVMVLDHKAEGVDDEEMFEKLKSEYQENFDMTWVGQYGFNNKYLYRGGQQQSGRTVQSENLFGSGPRIGQAGIRREPGLY